MTKRRFKPVNCVVCSVLYVRKGPRNVWCSHRCRLLDGCSVSNNLEDCWPWKHGVDKHGYGFASLKPHSPSAHRGMFREIYQEEITPKDAIMHVCDNPPCCNPFHLRRGSQLENVRDMVAKGRIQHYSNMAFGSRHAMSTITEATALAIFHMKDRSVTKVALHFGISRNIVERIRYGKNWNHVTGLPRRRMHSRQAHPAG